MASDSHSVENKTPRQWEDGFRKGFYQSLVLERRSREIAQQEGTSFPEGTAAGSGPRRSASASVGPRQGVMWPVRDFGGSAGPARSQGG